jgi:hypothetical protein
VILTLLNRVVSLAPSLVLFFALVYIAVRHQRLFLVLFMLLTALESTRDFAPSLTLTVQGFSVYPEDIVIVVGAVASLLGLAHWQLRWAIRAATLVVVGFVGLGLITWISAYGIQIGVNSWRGQILIAVLLLYTTTRPRPWSWNDLRVIILAPAIVVALASVAGILLHGLGSSASVIQVSGVTEGGRPISAYGGLLILVGLWVTLPSAGKWDISRVLVILLLGSMVVLTQQRSVWVGAVLGVVAWWVAPRFPLGRTSDGPSGTTRTVLILFVGAVTALVGMSIANLGQSASSDDTLLWRIARWVDSMSIPRSGVQWLVGSALGPTPASTPTLFQTSAHSLYVNAIELMGFIGFVAILVLIFSLARARVPSSAGPFGLMLCFTFLGFGATYQLPAWAWMLAGICLVSDLAQLTCEEQPGIHGEKPLGRTTGVTPSGMAPHGMARPGSNGSMACSSMSSSRVRRREGRP